MAFNGLITYAICKELQNSLVGGKIDKIYEPNSNEIILGVYHHNTKYALDIVVSPTNYRMCLTTSSKPNPTFAPSFCMLLRKYLIGTKINKIETIGLERLVIIELDGYSKSQDFTPKKLIIELMGKHSNIILTDHNNIIIDALKHFDTNSNSYRNIFPGAQYTLPISHKMDFFSIQNKDNFHQTLLDHQLENSLSLSDIMANTFIGFDKPTILAYCHLLNIEDMISKNSCDIFYEYIISLLQGIEFQTVCTLTKKGYYLTISPSKENLQINFFVDDYYTKKEKDENFISYRNNLSRLILNQLKKLNQKLFYINQKIEECKNLDTYRIYGELITNNLYRISDYHQDMITLENYYENNQPITIPLDKSLTPSSNAKKYFKKYHKLKNANEIVTIQKHEIEQEINYIESIVYELSTATTINDIDTIYHEITENADIKKESNKKNKKIRREKKKISTEKIGEPLYYEIDHFVVVVGKNNKQNDSITKHASPEDIWFHTKDIHGSHVILKTNKKQPSQETINQCAALAAYYSKANQTSNVSVDYTFIKFVKKPSGAKPGMVTYTNYKNVIVKPSCEFNS